MKIIRNLKNFFLTSLLFTTLVFPQDKFPIKSPPLTLKKAFDNPIDPNPIDVLHYDISLEVNPETKKITGKTGITIRPFGENSGKFYLNLIDLVVDSILIGNVKIKYIAAVITKFLCFSLMNCLSFP